MVYNIVSYTCKLKETHKLKEDMKMKKETAKALGYKVIDEFGSDISSIVRLEFEEGEIVKVIDEFDCNIITRVNVVRR